MGNEKQKERKIKKVEVRLEQWTSYEVRERLNQLSHVRVYEANIQPVIYNSI